MLSTYLNLFPSPKSTKLTPVRLTVGDMVNAHIEYVRYRPYMRPEIKETGTVLQVRNYKNTLYVQVQPDTNRAPRWVSEWDFVAYVPETIELELEDDPEYLEYLSDLAKAECEEELEEDEPDTGEDHRYDDWNDERAVRRCSH